MKIRMLIPAFSLLILMSCKTTTNTITYFQDLDNQMPAVIEQSVNYTPRIAPDDQLSITVSGTDPNAVAAFNMPLASYLAPGETNVTSTPVLHTYLVNSRGEIDFPVLGKIQVANMTRSELTDMMTEKISAYVKSPIVTIQIRNFKVSVLGEVNKPGTVNVPNERLSVLDALGMAGDLGINGKRKNVLVMREQGDEKIFTRVDLTSSEFIDSPFFYLQQNDVVYVEPNKGRIAGGSVSAFLPYILSSMSTIVALITLIVK
mgnify:CR=1 FL=1